MRSVLRTIVPMTACAVTLLSIIPCAHADVIPRNDAAYWSRQRDDWFWYREPPVRRQPKKSPPYPARPKELTDFDALQKKLEDLKRIAVMNPNEANLLAYMRFQRQVMQRAEVFAKRWQRLVWTTPELDPSVSDRPTNAAAIGVFDEQTRVRHGQVVRTLASSHALLFVFRGDCPYCHRLAPILKQFEREFGMTVFPVSLDGGSLPEYPDARPDNGLAARLDARVVPALYLTAPATREIRPVGFGVMALSELVERIATLASASPADPL